MGGVRGVFYFNVGAGWFPARTSSSGRSNSETYQRQTDVLQDENGVLVGVDASARVGQRLPPAGRQGVVGFGVETFVLGLPMHFDWAWRTTFNKAWRTCTRRGRRAEWRKVRFQFWIGFDFERGVMRARASG